MTEKSTGGPAFPCPLALTDKGMTLRDYFAAQAMQAILSVRLPEDELGTAARYAYAVADAMLEARND